MSKANAQSRDAATTKVEEDIEQYEKSPRPEPDSNPLDWWRVYAKQFQVLALPAKKYLCINSVHQAHLPSRSFVVQVLLPLKSILSLSLIR